MKPDHRHELKTNELAEWLSSLPQWTKENRTFIILVSVVIIVAAVFYIWRVHSKNVAVRKQLKLTSLIGQLLSSKVELLRAEEQAKDLSFILLQPAENLRIFAENTNDNQMAALALIKQADALRTELHYRLGAINKQEFIDQLNQAKESYAEALERLVAPATSLSRSKTAGGCPTNPSLMATAKFGQGLCEEEPGNFELAEQIYRDIITSPDFEGTVAAAQAKVRLETMADYKQQIVFPPAPKMPVIELTKPTDINTPDVNLGPILPNAVPEEPAGE